MQIWASVLGILSLCGIALPVTTSAQMIALWPGEMAPKGWRVCDGAQLRKANHAALFNAIGTTYGGSGEKFALPDLRKADESSSGSKSKVRYIISDGYPGIHFSNPAIGQVTLFAGNFPIRGFAHADGKKLKKAKFDELFKILGDRFGSGLPDLRKALVQKGEHTLLTSPLISLSGVKSETAKPDPAKLGDVRPYIGQVVLYAGSKPPRGWIACDGKPQAIDEEDLAFFSILGTNYGGNAREGLFRVPDLLAQDKTLKRIAGLDESSPYLFHMIAERGKFPPRGR